MNDVNKKMNKVERVVFSWLALPSIILMMITLFLFTAGWLWFETETVIKVGFTTMFFWVFMAYIFLKIDKRIKEKRKEFHMNQK